MADGSQVMTAHAHLPFSSIDVVFSAGVGVLLLVTAVGTHLRIRRARPAALPRPERVAPAAEPVSPAQPQAEPARARLPA